MTYQHLTGTFAARPCRGKTTSGKQCTQRTHNDNGLCGQCKDPNSALAAPSLATAQPQGGLPSQSAGLAAWQQKFDGTGTVESGPAMTDPTMGGSRPYPIPDTPQVKEITSRYDARLSELQDSDDNADHEYRQKDQAKEQEYRGEWEILNDTVKEIRSSSPHVSVASLRAAERAQVFEAEREALTIAHLKEVQQRAPANNARQIAADERFNALVGEKDAAIETETLNTPGLPREARLALAQHAKTLDVARSLAKSPDSEVRAAAKERVAALKKAAAWSATLRATDRKNAADRTKQREAEIRATVKKKQRLDKEVAKTEKQYERKFG